IGALSHHRGQADATSLVLVGTGFILTGFMNWSTRRLGGGARPEPTVAGAVAIGFAQAVAAVFRGVSRSGSTVCAALWGGLAPAAAAEFSFLLAVPVIAGAALLEGRHASVDIAAVGALPLAVGFALDAIPALAAQGAPPGTTVIAEEQTAGRGRDGRTWHSPAGGVWLGMLLKPARSELAAVAIRAGLAVADAVDALLGRPETRL